jgi:hypothetical protein
MNNIYEQKAKKYKYKYLKLKKEYLGEGGEYTEKKYVCQYSENNWKDALKWQIKLIESKNKDKNGNHIVKNQEQIYIYINSTQEIININKIHDRCKCLSFKLPLYDLKLWMNTNNNFTKLLTIVEINKIIEENNDIDIKEIDNKNYNNIDYHNLYFIHDVKINSQWNICNEEWKKNILPNLLYYYNINYYNNNNKNKNLLKYLHNNKLLINNNNKYLLFKYNNINYISYIIQENNERIQFTIINLVNGEYDIILYPLSPKIPKWFNVSTDDGYVNKFTDVKQFSKTGELGSNKGIEEILNNIQIVQEKIQTNNLLKMKEELEKEQMEKEQMENCGFKYNIDFNNNNNRTLEQNDDRKELLKHIFNPINNINGTCKIRDFFKKNLLNDDKCNKCANVLTKNLNVEYTKYKNNYKQ